MGKSRVCDGRARVCPDVLRVSYTCAMGARGVSPHAPPPAGRRSRPSPTKTGPPAAEIRTGAATSRAGTAGWRPAGIPGHLAGPRVAIARRHRRDASSTPPVSPGRADAILPPSPPRSRQPLGRALPPSLLLLPYPGVGVRLRPRPDSPVRQHSGAFGQEEAGVKARKDSARGYSAEFGSASGRLGFRRRRRRTKSVAQGCVCEAKLRPKPASICSEPARSIDRQLQSAQPPTQ